MPLTSLNSVNSGSDWKTCAVPLVTHPHFTGTGPRSIDENGKKAIEALCTNSFK
jgi:hypothetical protein